MTVVRCPTLRLSASAATALLDAVSCGFVLHSVPDLRPIVSLESHEGVHDDEPRHRPARRRVRPGDRSQAGAALGGDRSLALAGRRVFDLATVSQVRRVAHVVEHDLAAHFGVTSDHELVELRTTRDGEVAASEIGWAVLRQ